jgi:hypothetical protein
MDRKRPFSFLIRADERRILKELAQKADRSEGATLRLLIREKARELDAKTSQPPDCPKADNEIA